MQLPPIRPNRPAVSRLRTVKCNVVACVGTGPSAATMDFQPIQNQVTPRPSPPMCQRDHGRRSMRWGCSLSRSVSEAGMRDHYHVPVTRTPIEFPGGRKAGRSGRGGEEGRQQPAGAFVTGGETPWPVLNNVHWPRFRGLSKQSDPATFVDASIKGLTSTRASSAHPPKIALRSSATAHDFIGNRADQIAWSICRPPAPTYTRTVPAARPPDPPRALARDPLAEPSHKLDVMTDRGSGARI